MRRLPLLGLLALVLAVGGRAPAAEQAPKLETIAMDQAELRSGPSNDAKFYVTNRLRRGDRVQVLRERSDGWLEVCPPEGSFSWINTRFLNQIVPTMPNYVVVAPPGVKVPVLMGSDVMDGKPQVVGASLERSAQVHRFRQAGRLGQERSDADGAWMPIEPPDQEVRYLRSEAVAKAPAVPAVVALPMAPPAAPASGVSSFTPAPVPPGAASTVPTTQHHEVDELYNRAVQAERAGNINEAVRLYAQVGALGLPINHQYAAEAIRRADYLLTGAGRGPAPTADGRLYPMTPESVVPPSARLARPLAPSPTGADAAPIRPTATFTTARQADAGPQWIGRLRRAGRGIGDRPTYVLETASGQPFLYANAGAGVDLEAHVGQHVELIGSAIYYGELRANYMTVNQVRPTP